MIANSISLARGVLGVYIPFLVLSDSLALHAVALVLFIVGAVSDFFDGFLARKMNQVSDAGKFLDPLADKVFILGLLISFSLKGYYSIWWIVPIAAREILITFCRIGWLREGRAIGAETLGKWKLFSQVLSVSFSFLLLVGPAIFPASVLTLLKMAVLISLMIALALTLVSGFTFLKSNKVLFQSPEFSRFVGALGVGLLPFAPGTWGSLIGLALLCLTGWNIYLALGTFVLLAGTGYWSVKQSKLADHEDPGWFVIDEACGMFIAFTGVVFTPVTALAGFLLFRLFDIIKPFPLRRLERFPHYWGMMADDLGAAVYTLITMKILF